LIKSRGRSLFPIPLLRIIFSVFIIFGAIIFIINNFISVHDEDCGCFEWKYTNGIIVNNNISTQLLIDNDKAYILYRPDIIYEYTIDEVKYTSNNLGQYKITNIKKNIVEEYLLNFSIDKIIKVKYDKNWPENSIIADESEDKYILLSFNIISILFFLCGIGGLIVCKKIK
jgi:hypothetical protein